LEAPRRLFIAMFHDVSERKALEREVLEVDAEERRRIGQELHDTIAQDLLGIAMMTKDLAHDLQTEAMPQAAVASTIVRHLEQAQQHVRALSHSLVPGEIEANGLRAALTRLAEETRQVHKRDCVFSCSADVNVGSEFIATHLYRIAREAVSNSLKHSGARRIDLELSIEGSRLVLRVRDDGVGMQDKAKAAKGIGLRIMHYRASVIGADLTILPAETGGILVTCTLEIGNRASRGHSS
jgi:signal transduction histidine kinase